MLFIRSIDTNNILVEGVGFTKSFSNILGNKEEHYGALDVGLHNFKEIRMVLLEASNA